MSSARRGGRRLRFGIGSWIVSVLVLALSGCAGLSCQPASITVAEKEERARLETVPHGYTAETGGLEELGRPEIVRDYWALDADGIWHQVSLEQYRAAEVGQSSRSAGRRVRTDSVFHPRSSPAGGYSTFGQVPTPDRLMVHRLPLIIGIGGLYGAIEWFGTIHGQLRTLLNVQVAPLYSTSY